MKADRSSMGFDSFIVKVKRAETPFYQRLKGAAKFVMSPPTPRVPSLLKPIGRALYELNYGIIIIARAFVTYLYRQPLFQSRCASVGRNLKLDGKMPFVTGHVKIHIGDDVYLGGNLSVSCGRQFDHPQLVLKDRSSIGWNTAIACSREVVIEEDAIISYDCRISDTDGHSKDAILRAQHAPPDMKDIRPIRICRYAWVGNGTHIMKGVTIGEGAIVGANSVVISDIPPYTVALGNPAEVLFKVKGSKARGFKLES